MARLDKNQIMLNYLMTCDSLKNNSIFFNFATEQDNDAQFETDSNDIELNKPFIDGSVLKQYSFTLRVYKSVTFNPVVMLPNYQNENLADINDLQEVIDWLKDQSKQHLYPDFGEDILVDKMEVLTDNPQLDGVDSEEAPKLARYSISVKIEYIDNSERNH